ncbi:hypothetical protein MRB53_032679 [Persea americana]|uniref:Uncharacterized protein n=1 Tax=Persea americana TaxID=3435 RepID=A0ACC2KT24_PERAE|nr:hypothetical protein MRB53_032679 [Persea americana]
MTDLSPSVKRAANCSSTPFKRCGQQASEIAPHIPQLTSLPVECASVGGTRTAHSESVKRPHALGTSSSPVKLPCASRTSPSWLSSVPTKLKLSLAIAWPLS